MRYLSRALSRAPLGGFCPPPRNIVANPSLANARLRSYRPAPRRPFRAATPFRGGSSPLLRALRYAHGVRVSKRTHPFRPAHHFTTWPRSTSIGVWPSLRDRQDCLSAGATCRVSRAHSRPLSQGYRPTPRYHQQQTGGRESGRTLFIGSRTDDPLCRFYENRYRFVCSWGLVRNSPGLIVCLRLGAGAPFWRKSRDNCAKENITTKPTTCAYTLRQLRQGGTLLPLHSAGENLAG